MKQAYVIKEVVGDRYLEKATYPDSNYCKYTFANKMLCDNIETFTFASVEEAKSAYAEYLKNHSFTPFILQEIFVER